MVLGLRQLFFSKDLVWAWVGRIIRGRYQQSVLGWLWAFIQPLATVAIFTIVFTRFVPVDTGDTPYVIFSYVAVLPWNLLAMSLPEMTVSIVQNMNLVTKIYFPREIFPVSILLARLFDFGISILLLVLMMIFYQVAIIPIYLLYLMLVLIIQLALILGIGFMSSALNVFYRDVDPLLRLVIQLWFYASPIIYPVTMVPEQYRSFYYLNPMAGILEAYRAILLYQTLPGNSLYTAGIISFLLLVCGYWFFKKVEYLFADIV